MKKTRTLLDDLTSPGAIRMEFQPIVEMAEGGARLYMLEALARGPRGTTMERPDVLFEYARRKGVEAQMDMICIAEALASFASLPGETPLSLNVHSSTLASVEGFTRKVVDCATAYGIAADRLMLEIVEHRNRWAAAPFQQSLAEVREAGMRVAVDDLGMGASNYHLFVDCRPDHIKIDRSIVAGCSTDPWRRAVLASVASLAAAVGSTPIAEGVETFADLRLLEELGIDKVQGWLFARAMPAGELAQSPIFRTQSQPVPGSGDARERAENFANQHSRQGRSQEKTL
jgi:EAL domain-containing protein (putative c-di-GMP-specific phosphodiesterase class I)